MVNVTSLNDDTGRFVLRLTVAGLMLFHGVAKILHPGSLDYIAGMLDGYGLPAMLAYAVYVGEVIAPLMVILGYRARLGALLMAVNMLVAIMLAHTGDLFSLSAHGGWAIELQMFYLLTAVAVVFLGSGRYAVRPD